MTQGLQHQRHPDHRSSSLFVSVLRGHNSSSARAPRASAWGRARASFRGDGARVRVGRRLLLRRLPGRTRAQASGRAYPPLPERPAGPAARSAGRAASPAAAASAARFRPARPSCGPGASLRRPRTTRRRSPVRPRGAPASGSPASTSSLETAWSTGMRRKAGSSTNDTSRVERHARDVALVVGQRGAVHQLRSRRRADCAGDRASVGSMRRALAYCSTAASRLSCIS